MNENLLETRQRSIQILPIAVVLFVALSAGVFVENLHHSEFAFMAGVLVGVHGYWVALEAMTVVRVNRLLRRAAATGGEVVQDDSYPTGCRI